MKPTMKRSPGRPKHNSEGPTVRDSILKAASFLFMERGFEHVSLEQIAQACGVTKASLYYYFNNKATLFAAAIIQMMGNIRFYTQQLLEREGTLRERMKAVAAAHLRTPHFDFESMMREARGALTKQQMADIREAEESVHELVAESFRQAMERGEINRVRPLLAAHTFASAMMIRNRGFRGLAENPDDAAEEIVQLLWSGLLPRNEEG
ncbi:TetR/AcrR family transcriptional regulator [Paenibacillus koleovorans]|uniref:TetR/AcrR family transcriptional regulator n=1 Tax=Paenibacillus koleovorans TaxID=121608 RepID=UPI000FDA74C1|nr:TetR/AcrR family transcriptional regulator [Paenibacillus koleovorans]